MCEGATSSRFSSFLLALHLLHSQFYTVATMDLAESHLHVPYEQRWEHLKPTIVKIYLDESASLAQLAKRMADDFSFKAEYVASYSRVPTRQPSFAPPPPKKKTPLPVFNMVGRVSCHQSRIHQYRYHLKKWEVKKHTTKVQKEGVITVVGKRRRQHGIGTSNVQLAQGDRLKPVDKKQLKRYINDSIRTERPLSIQPGL